MIYGQGGGRGGIEGGGGSAHLSQIFLIARVLLMGEIKAKGSAIDGRVCLICVLIKGLG